MTDLLGLISRHGYIAVFAVALAEAIGLPMPAAVALVAAGAAAASGILNLPLLLALAATAMVLGDSLLYVVGRHSGWALLGVLCRVSVNPETCILRSAESFYKRGRATLVLAKFIPGINTMAAPLAGSMKMRPLEFLRFDLAGVFLYVTAYAGLGYLFRDVLAALLRGFQTAGRAVEVTLLVALIVYAAYRLWLYRKYAMYRVVPRVQVQELAQKLVSETPGKIMLVDVRSHGYYDEGAERIRGSVRIEPNNLPVELKSLSREKDIYLYCT